MRVLTLQPYYGESHRQFIDQWMDHSQHDWRLLSLPGRHWKWRMRHAAADFARQIQRLDCGGRSFDAIVATDMMNIAELKGFLSVTRCYRPVVLYFHENQFAYPSRFGFGSDQFKRDQHFAFTNYVSALAADDVWFNSQFNIDSMMVNLRKHAKSWPDRRPFEAIEALPKKFCVQPPGIERSPCDLAAARLNRDQRAAAGQPVHLVWAARWEHDKNPDGLLAALQEVRRRGIDFRLSVLGQQFKKNPPAFDQIAVDFKSQVVQWGFLPSRHDYWRALSSADVFVSTAFHEFFGLAAAEAIAAGLSPVLPDRVAYPELIDRLNPLAEIPGTRFDKQQFLYSVDDDPAVALADEIQQLNQRRGQPGWQIDEKVQQRFIDQLSWANRAAEMDRQLEEAVVRA